MTIGDIMEDDLEDMECQNVATTQNQAQITHDIESAMAEVVSSATGLYEETKTI
ncbi:hypothetical protein [Desulfosporosinus shakirovi]|uniref:hypothetical protein n=1 Tax=Desulfosporosinus shakirovi TaxID=2885154 RepID=UPI001E4A1705|nr:hypothetical protein [Desulfosporosinus sp. SRJS8]MCB8818276.1 hypothetical protein [Desulfosporosinus sp. SRJS8]